MKECAGLKAACCVCAAGLPDDYVAAAFRRAGFRGADERMRRPEGRCYMGKDQSGDAEDIYRQLESVAQTGRFAEQLASVLKNLLP